MSIESGTHIAVLAHERAADLGTSKNNGNIGGAIGGAGYAVYKETEAIHAAGENITLATAIGGPELPSLESYPFPTFGIELPAHETNDELIEKLANDERLRDFMMRKMRGQAGIDAAHFITGIGLMLRMHGELTASEREQRVLLGRMHSPDYRVMRLFNPEYVAGQGRIDAENETWKRSQKVVVSTQAEADLSTAMVSTDPAVGLSADEIRKKLVVVGLGVDLSSFNPDNYSQFSEAQRRMLLQELYDEHPFVIETIGRIHPERGTLLGVMAFAEFMQQSNPNAVLAIIGGAGKGSEGIEEEQRVHEYIQSLPPAIQRRIIITGVIPHTLTFAASDVSLNPTHFETFGLSDVENAAAGKICIVSDNPVKQEVLGGHARYVDTHNPAEMAMALEQVYRNRERARDIGQAAATHVQRYTWENTAQALLQAA